MAQDILFCCEQRLFFSDGSQYTVGLDGDRKLILDKPYIVRCDANTKGPETDTMDPQTFIKNEKQALTPHTFHRAGYCFDGWNTDPDGNGSAYDDAQEINVTDYLTLNAQLLLNKHKGAALMLWENKLTRTVMMLKQRRHIRTVFMCGACQRIYSPAEKSAKTQPLPGLFPV